MAKIYYDRQVVIDWFRDNGLDEPATEVRFHPDRKWRFDFAWPDQMIALEVEGGIFTRGRHQRPAGMLADIEKYSTCAAMGWALIRTTPQNLCMNETLDLLKMAFARRDDEESMWRAKALSAEQTVSP
jgi:hypothetical protein